MLLQTRPPLSPDERALLELWKGLDARRRETLLDFARWLAARAATSGDDEDAAADARVPGEPLGLPRPESESVVAAMRRLSRNYPMLDSGALLDQAAALMGSHVLQGRDAAEVIDELEALFERAWRRHAGLDD